MSLEEFGQFEDDELLAAPRYGDDAGDEAGQAGDVGLGGFADGAGVVRVWFEGHRLVKVRMSSIWYSKIPRGAGLEDCFRQAFLIARAMTGLPTPEPEPEPEPEDEQDSLRGLDDPIGAIPGHMEPELEALPEEVRGVLGRLPRLNAQTLAACHELLEQAEARYAQGLQQAEQVIPDEEVSGTSAGVTVHLTSAGFPERVEFDQGWVEAQHSGTICSCVEEAAEQALVRYEALEFVASTDLEDLRRERDLLRAAYLALLTPEGEL